MSTNSPQPYKLLQLYCSETQNKPLKKKLQDNINVWKPMKCQVTRKTYKWTLCSDHKPLKIYIYMKISQKRETRAQKGKWLLKYTKRDQKLNNNQKQTTEPHERNSWIHRIVSLKLCVATKSSFEYFCHFFRFLWQLFSGLNLQHFVLESSMNFVHKALIKRQRGKSRHVHFYTVKLTINQHKAGGEFYSKVK